MSPTIAKVHQCAYHRNGVGGEAFWAVVFDSTDDDGRSRRMLASVFADDVARRQAHPGTSLNPHIAVYDIGLLAEVGVAFGANSWRGDNYFEPLCDVIGSRDWFAVEAGEEARS